MTPQETRNDRLMNDYKEMCNIRGPIIQWRAIKGVPPLVEAYELTVNVRSVISSKPDYRDRHVIKIEIPSGYPLSPLSMTMTSDPVVFHPNWYKRKTWCFGSWNPLEGLGHLVIRMLRTLQYDPNITNEESPANWDAKEWYLANRHRNLFPCDRQILPDPMKSKFEIQTITKKKFEIQ
jgi:ubiquitin-protein ligase